MRTPISLAMVLAIILAGACSPAAHISQIVEENSRTWTLFVDSPAQQAATISSSMPGFWESVCQLPTKARVPGATLWFTPSMALAMATTAS